MAAWAAWEEIQAEDLLAEGIQAEWKDTGAPGRLEARRTQHNYNPAPRLAVEYTRLLEEELREGIVEEADPKEVRWINPTFLVPKKNGKFRKILDCRELNAELRDVSFAMEGAETVRDLARKGDWATSLDIHSAFSHIPVNKDLQPYLGFKFRSKTYTYKGMPFGVKNAPRVFTLLMRRVAAAIRERWATRMVCYMDDLLLLFEDRVTAETQTAEIAGFLGKLGWTLAEDKCERTPTQHINFLGWNWDLQHLSVAMTPARRADLTTQLRDWIQHAIQRKHRPVRELAALIGNLNFLRLQWSEASLHLKTLDGAKSSTAWRAGWTALCTANPSWLGDLKWWSRQITQNHARQLQEWPHSVTLTTDASPYGWGATLQTETDQRYSFGFWNSTQQTYTSNAKELIAVQASLQRFRGLLRTVPYTTVLLRSDNSTVVADINRLSASRSLLVPLRRLLTTIQGMKVRVTAAHIPGVENSEADRLSRMGRIREYYLRQTLLQELMRVWDITPESDPFASSPYLPSQTAMKHPTDALRTSWIGRTLFLHPPPHLLGKTLSKIRRENARAILIAPAWRSQPWSPLLSRLSLQRTTLGTFEETMETTPRFRKEGWQLPPGQVVAALLDTRMMRESASSTDF
jgi:ribonuclease HI